MNREQSNEAKRLLAEISTELQRNDLSSEQREKLEINRAQLAGALLHPWLPFGWWRKALMLVLLLLGMLWPLGGSAVWAMAWLIMLSFSPRIVGNVVFAFGRFAAGFKGGGA